MKKQDLLIWILFWIHLSLVIGFVSIKSGMYYMTSAIYNVGKCK